MSNQALWAVSPIDGRYRKACENLSDYFSEGALIKYRIRVEIEYFIALCELPLPQLKGVSKKTLKQLPDIYKNLTEKEILEVKKIEQTTNHDVKAVEYFIKGKFEKLDLKEQLEFVHFGLTSQDINNTSVPLSIKEMVNNVYTPALTEIIALLEEKAKAWKKVSMLARTHGQPASPTRLGKEIMVFVERLREQIKHLKSIPYGAKFGGATGNFNAHQVAYPSYNWVKFGNAFVKEKLGLTRQQTTTQIEHYDNMGALFDCLKRINTILLDLDRDMWAYVSMNYFKQKVKAGEVGSSAMPHKVNPIDFENSEGNLGIANALFEHLSAKLPISRLQRDLTDSTVLRNVGVPFAHTMIAFASLKKGLGKIELNAEAIHRDLEENWAVVAEAIQTILRREGYPKPYEALKDLTRTGEKINEKAIKDFIGKLKVKDSVKKELLAITPWNYTGV
jgi:adenylosuccinate lyase